MKEWFKRVWNKYYKPTYRVVAFMLSATIIVLSFPDAGGFSYEYELQRPWRYENIIAPFDFPIYKTEAELAAERDSLMLHFRPVYRRDTAMAEQAAQQVSAFVQGNSHRFGVLAPRGVSADTLRSVFAQRLLRELSAVYERGVVELPGDLANVGGSYELMVLTGNVMEPFALDEMLTQSQAYTSVVNNLKAGLAQRYQGAWVPALVDRLPIADIIRANITFDKERTAIGREAAMERMSLTQGRVMAGQRVIGTGDIVDRRAVKVLDSLKKAYDVQNEAGGGSLQLFSGLTLIVVSLLTMVFLFLYFFRRDVFGQLHCINFVLMLLTVCVLISGVIAGRNGNISFIVPFTLVPIVLRIFLDSRLAFFVHVVLVLIVSFMSYNSQQFMLLHIPAGMVAIICLVNLTRRGQIVRAAVMVFISYSIIYSGYTLWRTLDFDSLDPNVYVRFAFNALLILMSYPLIYVFERMFGFLSDVTLMELSDTNHPLLRELSEKAPGTFQHSVQVGNLAQEVAYRIGANAMLVRTGAMYHDIGKMVSPMYFTENQAAGVNPHDGLDYEESAQIVIKHVENGIKIARQHGIPQQVIDIIQMHHGDSQARYFYIAWCNEHPGEEPDMSRFSYKGPVPQTKEAALIMMADAVEASSKSLKQYTPEGIDALVEKIVAMQIDMKELRGAPITFSDIEVAKQVFKEKLQNIYHSRIQYPELLK